MASVDDIFRLHYVEGQYLGAADLEAQQLYLRDMRRRHNVAHHTAGIVTGLVLTEVAIPADPDNAVDVYIQPGFAVDGFGREIIVMAPTKLDPALFDSFVNKAHHSVWIAYNQEPSQADTNACSDSTQYARILETFKIEIDPKDPTQLDPVVNGKSVDNLIDPTIVPDLSVPFQEFPDDDIDSLWLIQLGWVNWDGGKRKFLKAQPPSRLVLDRSYAGVVADTVYSPAIQPDPQDPNFDPGADEPRFFIKPRFPQGDPDTVDFMKIEGRLQVDGRIVAEKNVQLFGGRLEFLDVGGVDDKVPLWMQRTIGDDNVGSNLRVHIGDALDAKNGLSIGPKDGGVEKTVLAVKGDNRAVIPTGTLDFASVKRQMINLFGKTHGVGVQNEGLYLRTDAEFRWYRGGTHNDDGSDPSNGALQLRLDASANLYFGSQVRQMLNLWDTKYAIGVQASTLYFRTDGNFCWFRGGTHADTAADPGGGTRAMMLDVNSKLTVSGELATLSNLGVSGNANIVGQLSVSGDQNLVDVFTETQAVQNNGNAPAAWVSNHSGRFSKIYARFVVFQGFSLFNNAANTAFNTFGRNASADAIPQHAFVRITSSTNDQTTGVCYCLESTAALETDNTILFTVVVIGKPLAPV